jgi:uncharacterized membrane protein
MIRTDNHICIDAPAATIFALAQEVGAWPGLLAHYRYVRVLLEAPGRRVVRMGARRGPIPVHWTSEQAYDPTSATIEYRHIGGVTRGMEVEWRIVRSGRGHEVSISHSLSQPCGLLRLPFAERVASALFIRPIAQRTLRGIKVHAEAAPSSGWGEK